MSVSSQVAPFSMRTLLSSQKRLSGFLSTKSIEYISVDSVLNSSSQCRDFQRFHALRNLSMLSLHDTRYSTFRIRNQRFSESRADLQKSTHVAFMRLAAQMAGAPKRDSNFSSVIPQIGGSGFALSSIREANRSQVCTQ